MTKITDKTASLMELVKQQRQKKGILKREMAKRLGIKPVTYGRWEQGAMSIDELSEVMNHLDLVMILIDKDQII